MVAMLSPVGGPIPAAGWQAVLVLTAGWFAFSAWRGRAASEQLRRFMGSGGSRKIRYARYLVEALKVDAVPRPLDRLLTHV